MELLELALVGAVLALPLYLLVQRERTCLRDPRHIRSFGAVVAQERVRVLEDAEVVGTYSGGPIYSSIEYLGMRYRFDRIMPSEYRHLVRPRELFVEPGLVYLTD